MSGLQRLTPKHAVIWGHMVVTIPVFLVVGLLSALSCALLGSALPGMVVGPLVGWLWWSFSISRWRDWVEANGLRSDDVQELAVQTWLLWPRGSWLERTEVPKKPKGGDEGGIPEIRSW